MGCTSCEWPSRGLSPSDTALESGKESKKEEEYTYLYIRVSKKQLKMDARKSLSASVCALCE